MTTTLPPMPEPSFRLSWSAAGYRVSEPNINDTDVYTLEQIQARDAQWMERITSLEADRKMLREVLTQTTRLLGELVAKDAQTYAPYMRVIDAARAALENKHGL